MSGRNGFTSSSRERARGRLSLGLWAIALVLVAPSPASAAPCGGDNQRGCCWLEPEEVKGRFRACRPGLVEVKGCGFGAKGCKCGGASLVGSDSTCRKLTACGGEGQRACCGNEREATSGRACKDGFKERAGGVPADGFCRGGLAKSNGMCVKQSCGGEGQRACCLAENRFACHQGLFQMPGTGDGALCEGGVKPLGTCVRASPAGGLGQRARCPNEMVRSKKDGCDKGLKPMKGCSGDCFCDTSRDHLVPPFAPPMGAMSTHSCTKLVGGRTEKIAEPGTQWMAPTSQPSNPMRGYADMHVHLFGHMAHGGGAFAGKPYGEDPNVSSSTSGNLVANINDALRPDHGTNMPLEGIDGRTLVPWCPGGGLDCPKHVFHGDHAGADWAVFGGTQDGANGNLGAPTFSGWPRWTSTVHQQVYYKWLERAWRGGLRLMSMLAVTNEAACRSARRKKRNAKDPSRPPFAPSACTDSMKSIDAQLDMAPRFEAFIDKLSGGKGLGWFRIVRSPNQARAVIKQGKLAVVLGIEVDNLFGCKENASKANASEPAWKGSECSKETIAAKVDKYYKMGVRHVFPIHNFDNAFGGAAAWQDVINFGNGIVEGRWWEQENCYAPGKGNKGGYGFWLDTIGLANFRGGFPHGTPVPAGYPHYEGGNGNVHKHASCNKRGLSDRGEFLIRALMDKGMLIDVDHMSRHSLNKTLELTAARKYPVVASHVIFFQRHKQKFVDNGGRHERMRTEAQLKAIRDGGGLVAAMLKDDVQDGDRKGQRFTVPYLPFEKAPFSDRCTHSTRTFAHSLLYGIDTMKGPVAFGSDFNGMAGHIGPRFGSEACGGNRADRSLEAKHNKRLQYPFTLDGFGKFDKQVTGHKTFDFNVDGLAHIGLMPDMLADLLAIGVTKERLEPVFKSAEAYVNVWAKAVKTVKPGKPTLFKGTLKKK